MIYSISHYHTHKNFERVYLTETPFQKHAVQENMNKLCLKHFLSLSLNILFTPFQFRTWGMVENRNEGVEQVLMLP